MQRLASSIFLKNKILHLTRSVLLIRDSGRRSEEAEYVMFLCISFSEWLDFGILNGCKKADDHSTCAKALVGVLLTLGLAAALCRVPCVYVCLFQQASRNVNPNLSLPEFK